MYRWRKRLENIVRGWQRSLLHRLGFATHRDLREMQQQLSRQAATTRWLIDQNHAGRGANKYELSCSETSALISIVMPVWNREETVKAAIESLLAQTYFRWELLVVDDGSRDRTVEIVSEFTGDPRIRLLTGTHVGVCAARNRALREVRGEIVAYLDSDNTWFPHYLAEVARAFEQHPEEECVYAAQIVEHAQTQNWYLRAITYDRERFLDEGGIDLNAFAHRSRLVLELGDFDEQLTRLVDWELILRYTRARPPRLLPTIAGIYAECRPDSISASVNFARNKALIQRRHRDSTPKPLRVLYAVWNYPQLTETYIRCEIAAMQRWGVHVEVWSEIVETKSPYACEVPIHHGSLEDAIAQVRPDVVHVHWLNKGKNYRDIVARAGLPMTVRGHSFEFAAKSVKKLLGDPAVRSVYLFPHFARQIAPHPKIRPMTSAFNEHWFYPAEKNRRLILRTGAGKPTKGLESFLEIASLCPDHQFVLVLGRLPNLDDYLERLLAENRRLGSPVDIRLNLSNEESAALIREAGIYLHTYGDEEPFGMPVSIAEALATGAYTLTRDLPGAAAYLGETGAMYRSSNEAAALIQNTLSWSDADWHSLQQRTAASARQRFASDQVLRCLLDDWLSITDRSCVLRSSTPIARAA